MLFTQLHKAQQLRARSLPGLQISATTSKIAQILWPIRLNDKSLDLCSGLVSDERSRAKLWFICGPREVVISIILFFSSFAIMIAILCYDIMAIFTVIYIKINTVLGPFRVLALVFPLPAGWEHCWSSFPSPAQPEQQSLLQMLTPEPPGAWKAMVCNLQILLEVGQWPENEDFSAWNQFCTFVVPYMQCQWCLESR